MSAVQLDMFPDLLSLQENVVKYKDSSDKVRRGVFARVGELDKKCEARFTQQQSEIDQLKKALRSLIPQAEIFSLQEACL